MNSLAAKDTQKSRAWFTFFAALCIAAAIFVPFIIKDGGMFFYYGDYNVQEIPFYQHAHQMIREGNFAFDFGTDLGANFIGSYSFYMLGSPFFWAMLPFPNSWIPYMMGPMFILKFAVMAAIAYHYIKRFVHNTYLVSLGSILYAFCGFNIYNVFFNHFVDVAVFFPLLLIGLEKAVAQQKYGFFAFAVAVNMLINYFFFVGEVTFLIIYFLCRLRSSDFNLTWPVFFHLAFESILGLCGGMVLLLPGLMALMGNSRIESFLTGIDILVYPGVYRYGELINSLFFMPELPARHNFFTGEYAQWSSMSLWIPLFGAVGVITFFAGTGKNFVKRVLTVSAVFALIPVLNSSFYAFNNSYYARWFYMPLLVMCIAAVKVFEISGISFRKGFVVSGAAVAFFALFGLLPVKNGDSWTFGIGLDNVRLWVWVFFAAVCLALTGWLVKSALPRGIFEKSALLCSAVVIVTCSVVYLGYGKTFSYGVDYMTDTALKDTQQVALQDNTAFYRSDFYGAMDNLGMYWDTSTTQCFHTVVPSSIMDFYNILGLSRDVRSAPTLEHYGLNSLLSVKYLYEDRTYGDAETLYDPYGYVQVKESKDFAVWQNTNWLPMGFGYQNFLTMSQLQQVSLTDRTHAMLKGVVLQDEDIDSLSKLLTPLADADDMVLAPADLEQDVQKLREVTCSSVEITKTGLISIAVVQSDTFMFYSIPYDNGFTAYVDGTETAIYRANVGFCGVVVPEGIHTVEFVYRTPGLSVGLWCLAAFAVIWPIYTAVYYRKRSK